MKYLAVLGRQAEISVAELEALFRNVRQIAPELAVFESDEQPDIDRLGGCLKLAEPVGRKPLEFLAELPEDGKMTLGLSDYSPRARAKAVQVEALKLKKILVRHGRSVRVVASAEAVLSTATSLHNGLGGQNPLKMELIKNGAEYYRVIGVQDIDAYARRDQARPARDAKNGMLPPKLAQILINLCGPLEPGARVLDPFCGTGVVLQEALLMGYAAYGTDLSEKMVEYSTKNIEWLLGKKSFRLADSVTQEFLVEQGDAVSFEWKPPIDAVACEGYLGSPMSKIPAEIKLKEEKQICGQIVVSFLANLAGQIKSGTPVTIAVSAWLDKNGKYSRLKILDEIDELGYNVSNKSRNGLMYFRSGQIVARDILILRKK